MKNPLTVLFVLTVCFVSNAEQVDSPVSQRKAGKKVTNSIGMTLLYCPEGSFRMGAPVDSDFTRPNEREVDVTLSEPFYLGKYEVTQRDWKAVMKSSPWKNRTRVRESDQKPAVYIGWKDAREFCERLSQKEGKTYRLPTEAEWEYACRAGTRSQFYFSDAKQLPDHAWFGSNTSEIGQRYAHSVGVKKPNPWGFHDMYGNVQELCLDTYLQQVTGGRNPIGRKKAEFCRVMKGGGFMTLMHCRSAARTPNDVFTESFDIGFRVCLETKD